MPGTQFVQELHSPSFLRDAVLDVPLKINAERVMILAPGTLVVTSPEGITKTFVFAEADGMTVFTAYPIVLDMKVRVVATGTTLDLDDELVLLA